MTSITTTKSNFSMSARHRNYRDKREKRAVNTALVKQGINAIVTMMKSNGATEAQVKDFLKGVGESKSTYHTGGMEKALYDVIPKGQAEALEFFLRGISHAKSGARDGKMDKPWRAWAPLRDKLESREEDVRREMRREIGKSLDVYMGSGDAPEGKLKVPTSREKQVKNLGIREINGRFILSSEQVDEVGEFKLFQISYVSRGDSAASNALQWGFVATYNGKHHAFAQSPARAMSAAKTNMVKSATAKLTR